MMAVWVVFDRTLTKGSKLTLGWTGLGWAGGLGVVLLDQGYGIGVMVVLDLFLVRFGFISEQAQGLKL